MGKTIYLSNEEMSLLYWQLIDARDRGIYLDEQDLVDKLIEKLCDFEDKFVVVER